ncbi:nuclear receptor coactivator 4-like [Tubulanus polymorphus]|uniref:nuclear receptor coactivator 4-like n=1 Tax=Tubulanus polymorphus TaxID=672921 RepID=UPI003DA3E3E7
MISQQCETGCGPEYFNEVRQQIGLVEETIAEINLAKQQLQDNAQEVKSQIHTTISRQLEILRSREVWLLNQVEIVKEAKDDILRKQQASLDQALGGLKNLEYSGSTSSIDSIELKLKESLERLKDLHVQPESPHITFKADKLAFRKAIHKFGKIDAQGVNPEVVFADPKVPSTCLPHYFEDYGDVEHHMLYKTVEDINRDQHQDNCIHVKLPKLNKDGWLLHKRSSPSSVASAKMSLLFPSAVSGNAQGWLQKSKSAPSTPDELPCVGADASIQQWLKRLKDGPEMEDEEGFEMLNHSHRDTPASELSESIEVVSHSDMDTTCYDLNVNPVNSYFVKVLASPSKDWLMSSKTSPNDVDMDCTQLNNASVKTAENTGNTWLLAKKPDKNFENRLDFCMNSCGMATASFEIESLDGLKCVDNPVKTYYRQIPKEVNAWLCQKKDECDVEDIECNEEISRVCRANELCCSFTECCCEPHCGKNVTTDIEMEADSETTEADLEEDKPINNVDQWLFNGGQNTTTSTDKPSVIDFLMAFESIRNSSNSNWLLNKSNVSDENCARDPNSQIRNVLNCDTSKWLKSSSDDICEKNLSSGKIVDEIIDDDANMSQWLSEKCSLDSGKREANICLWLSKKSRSLDDDNEPEINMFSHVFQARCSSEKWLLNSLSRAAPESSEVKLKNDGTKMNFGQWLLESA